MIKNKILDINIIFKNIKNILSFQTIFLLYKKQIIIFKNYSKKLFFRIVFLKPLPNKLL